MARPLRVQVLVLRDCTPIVPVGIVDLLRKTVELAATIPSRTPRPRLELSLISGTRATRVRAAGGVRLICDHTIEDARHADLIVVPAMDPDVIDRLTKNGAVVSFLERAYRRGADVASACTGAFLVAEAGLLEGRSAATHWAFQPLFAARYPRVRVVPEAVVVDSGRVVTAGGATSFLNLTLFLVERFFGADVARAASKMFLIDANKAPQSAYAMFSSQRQHDDEAIKRVQESIESAPGEAHVEGLAKSAAMSVRTFARRFSRATGNNAREYIQRVRIEAAKRALEQSREPVAAIASRVGYADAVAFRKVFARITGLTPSDYRDRYGLRSTPSFVSERRKPIERRRGRSLTP